MSKMEEMSKTFILKLVCAQAESDIAKNTI
jgi:hypothetical protein